MVKEKQTTSTTAASVASHVNASSSLSTSSSCVKELFGSAMKISLWDNFVDVSDIRPVPDHQEVFMHKEIPVSLIIELNEHDPAVYEDYPPALEYFSPSSSLDNKGLFNGLLHNLLEYANDKAESPFLRVRRVERITPDLDLLSGPGSEIQNESGIIEADVGQDSDHFTRVSLVLIWLKEFNTHILAILNLDDLKDLDVERQNTARNMFDIMQVVSSLKIHDTSLFL